MGSKARLGLELSEFSPSDLGFMESLFQAILPHDGRATGKVAK